MIEVCEFHGFDREACLKYSGKFPCEDLKEEDEQDFLIGKTCNPDAPEECESCQ